MGEQWDYKTRKVEIAWKLAQMAIERRLKKFSAMNDEPSHKMVNEELQTESDNTPRAERR